MLAHQCSVIQCSRCSASVVDRDALHDHWIEFHCCSPPRKAARRVAAAAAVPFEEALSSRLGWCEQPGCSLDFSTWQHYTEHYLERHGSPDPNFCAVCLSSHSVPHGDLDFKCGRCTARFTTECHLTNHMTSFHRADVVIGWCSFLHCGQPFKSWKDQVEHQKKRHCTAAESDALCHFCLELHPVGLQDHLQVHALWDVACSLCSGRFLDDGDVARHKADFHHVATGDKVPPVLGRCAKCPATFSSWEDNVQHQVIRHHKKDPDLVCPHCLAPFPTVEAAKTHVSRHSEGKDFPCNLCRARLTSEKTRTKHLQRFHAQD